jgi:hypothetical protein
MKSRINSVLLAVLIIGLFSAACGERAPVVADNGLQLTRLEGDGLLQRAGTQNQIGVPASLKIGPHDEISSASQALTLQLADGSVLRLEPGTRISLSGIQASDERPIIRLWRGDLHVSAHSDQFLLETYREVAIRFGMVPRQLSLQLKGSVNELHLWFEDDIAKVYVENGEIDVQADTSGGTLTTGWQAELEPTQPLRIIQVLTPTPGPTLTPTDTLTPTVTPLPTDTPTGTPTPTDTPTPTPTRRPTLRPIATATPSIVPITDTPSPPEHGPGPKPPKPINPPPPPPPPPGPKPTP